MADEPKKGELAGTEHQKTWKFFMFLTKWASLATAWIVGMLVAVFGLGLSPLPPLIVLTILVAVAAFIMR